MLDSLNVMVITEIEHLGGKYYAIFLWMLDLLSASVVHLFIVHVAPLLFNMHHFRPLPPGELREAVENLAVSVGFPFRDIYISSTTFGPSVVHQHSPSSAF